MCDDDENKGGVLECVYFNVSVKMYQEKRKRFSTKKAQSLCNFIIITNLY